MSVVLTTDAIREEATRRGLTTPAALAKATGLPFGTCQKVFRAREGEAVFHESTLRFFTEFFGEKAPAEVTP